MSRQIVEAFYQALTHSPEQLSSLVSDDFSWAAAHPINDLESLDDCIEKFWRPIATAMPDVERKVLVDVEGDDNGQQWVMASGYFIGNLVAPLFGIPTTGRALHLRFTEIIGVKDGLVNRGEVILDFLDAMNQVGVNPIRPSLGFDGLIMAPTRASSSVQDSSLSTVQLIKDMLAELGRYDGQSLESMKLADYWHDDFMWYGPAGIGTTRGIDGFRRLHQGPFLRGFPDRSVDVSTCYVGEGDFAATGGWPHMSATHTGPHWLGLAATGQSITLRVMDIWRRDGDKLKENWVGIDIIHILLQLGLDVFELMDERFCRKA
ncbi:ester cyclase [Umboniibacter marinipuniceus]|uniref:Putative ester cyclase n=1 Tax=Umboniibacter marinipuniceus TaxID=569599 RepID=A0A3M0AIQ5_9GAMM|nr:ester cyclase [Umboniibacter marinipuniceus]RMA82435.1 putative ester cyclase [Umboniibacter marinipuniceus]